MTIYCGIQETGNVLYEAVRRKVSIDVIALLASITPGAKGIVQSALHFEDQPNYQKRVLATASVLSSDMKFRNLTVHLCGDSGAGKTTLKMSLYHCIRNIFGTRALPDKSLKGPDKLMSTIGLEKERVMKRDGEGEFVLYDYGGQDEYHVNHSPHLSSGPGSVYVVVVGLAYVDDDNSIRPRGNESEKECARLVERYGYWLRFINSVAAPASLVVTILNFQSVASTGFREAVHEEIVNRQKAASHCCELRNLQFWPDIVMGDVLTTKEVFESSFYQEIEKIIAAKKPSIISGGVLAVRRFRQRWPKVLLVEKFTMECVWPALLEIAEVRMASTVLSVEELISLKDILLKRTLDNLLDSGDILEMNGYVVTDFNWFTSSVVGKLFRPYGRGWGMREETLEHVRRIAMTSSEIEEITGLQRDQFGGNVNSLPQLLEKLRVCKQLKQGDGEEKYWFPAFRPVRRPSSEALLTYDPVRVVKRRFYLNDDYIFPPGYFADIYMNITELDPNNHEIGFWEDCMKFESIFEDANGEEYVIGVYISVEHSSHFDLMVCSTNPHDQGETATLPGAESVVVRRVWNWLNRVREYVYSASSDCKNLVKEWCVNSSRKSGGEMSFQEVFVEKELNDRTLLRRYYYGTCESKTATEEFTQEEAIVLVTMLEGGLIDLSRDSAILINSVNRNFGQILNYVKSQLENVKGKLPLSEKLVQLFDVVSSVESLETEVGDKLQEEICQGEFGVHMSTSSPIQSSGEMTNHTRSSLDDQLKMPELNSLEKDKTVNLDKMALDMADMKEQLTDVNIKLSASRVHQNDDLDGVHEMPLFPLLSDKRSSWFTSKHKKRLHFVCPVCLQKAAAGPKGKGYAIYINKDWFNNALPYLKVATLVLRIGLRIAGLPPDVVSLLEEACTGSGDILQEAVCISGEELSDEVEDPVEMVLSANEGTIDADDIEAISSSSPPTLSEDKFPIVLPRMSMSDRAALRDLMFKLENRLPPRFSGLERVTCREQGSTAWMCTRPHAEGGSCRDVFLKRGVDCLKLIYADDVPKCKPNSSYDSNTLNSK